MTGHISSAYDRDLEDIQALVMQMGGRVEDAISKATQALITADAQLAQAVRAEDREIDALEEQINEAAAKTIALRAPVSKDLRTVLSVIRLAASLERIGDYAKNIAKRSATLTEMPLLKLPEESLKNLSREVQLMLKDALDSYVQGDAELANAVRLRDQQVDQMYNALFAAFLTSMNEDHTHMAAYMHLHFMAKNIERMGDLVTNMAEQVIYLVTGDMPDEDRPKGDKTSFVTDV